MNESLGRTLPHSIADEEHLLAYCFIDGAEALARCVFFGISPLSFYDSRHGIIFDIMLDLYLKQRAISADTVASELKQKKQFDAVGGYSFILQCSQSIPTTSEAVFFIERVKALATRRGIILACNSAVEECYSSTEEIDELATKVSQRVNAATDGVADKSEESFQESAKQIHAELSLPPSQRPKNTGEVQWGLVDIDRGCGRMQPGNLVILAGMPSTGKSALADQIAWGCAATGKEVLVFTYEMTKREKAIRIAQQVSRLNYDQFDASPRDMQTRFLDAAAMIRDCKNLHVYERDITVNRLVSRVRSFKSKGKKIGLIVVDFLQYLSRLEPQIGKERTDEKIGRLTAALKKLAGECECPVLLLSSLNREGYKDGNRPTMASLRASGEIESDADVIGILHWPKKWPNGDEQDPKDSGQNTYFVEFNQDKGRTKGVHQIPLVFARQATRFENYTP